MKDVVDFISHFKGAEETFLHGCCYWFAWILQKRFHERGYLVDIFHEPVEGHFIARFIRDNKYSPPDPNAEERYFDVRGDVTELYADKPLENMWLMSLSEERRWGRLLCDCRDFIEPNDYPDWLRN